MPILGAIAGDIIGSIYEHHPPGTLDFPLLSSESRFTDDSVMTIATTSALLGDHDLGAAYRHWALRYPRAGYGSGFRAWLYSDDPQPYHSWGNGSTMRVSPVAWFATSETETLNFARESALPTHNHPRGIIGAQATALTIWLARRRAK